MLRDRALLIVLAAYSALAAWTIHHFDGTGDAGDSVMHFLYARYAPLHPALFFDHWAKPLFVLLASPLAQFGFTGMKVFNALISGLTLIASYGLARHLHLRRPWLAPVFVLCCPQFFVLTFSGLTEPLFACLLAWCLLLLLRNALVPALVLASFLPFVRSEGLIMMGVIVCYLVVHGRSRPLPLLLTGSVHYGLAGWPVHGDPLWPFTRIPYARLSSTYGSGTPFHFVDELVMVLGVPVFILFWVGVLVVLVRSIRTRAWPPPPAWLLLTCVLAFMVAHGLFWWLGIFNSMGLGRVLVCVVPPAAVVALIGVCSIADRAARWRSAAGPWTVGLLTAYVLVFPFTPNPAAIWPDRDLRPLPDQHLITRTVEAWKQLDRPCGRVWSAHPCFPMALDLDPFDPAVHQRTGPSVLTDIRPGDVVFWDSWFCPVETGVTRSMLEAAPQLVKLLEQDTVDRHGRRIEQVVYQQQ